MASEISTSERGPDWANLFPEILALVAKRLAALDYLNFTDVCREWASIASPGHGMPPPIPLRKPRPFLLMRGDDGEQSDSVTLLDVFDNPRRSYKIGNLPGIGGKWFVGSQFGWVALIDEFSDPSLLNPFTGARIELPPIATLPDVEPVYDPNGSLSGYTYPRGEVSESYSLEEFRSELSIRKVILSSDPTDGNFMAAAIFGLGLVIFLRPGDKTWSYLKFPSVDDTIIELMYREGKFLALTDFGQVYEIDHCNLSVRDRVVAKGDGRSYPLSQLQYLLDSSGDLLHVYRASYSDGMDIMSRRYEFDIQRLDPEMGEWVPWPSLGDRALFVGASCTMSLPTGGENGVKGNCIYFTDHNWDQLLTIPDEQEKDRDMGVYDMISMSFEIFYPPNPQLKWPPPIWIMSPLL